MAIGIASLERRVVRAASRWAIALLVALQVCTAADPLAAQQVADKAADGKTICAREAPWNLPAGSDPRAKDIKKASDWAKPALLSKDPNAGLTGIWSFELKGIPGGGDFPNAGMFIFVQEGAGYDCVDGTCGYQPAPAGAKWLRGGERWGHSNYGLRTEKNPEDFPIGHFTVDNDGTLQMPQPEFYPFAAITAHFDARRPDRFTGRWTIDWGGEKKTGAAVFTRIAPKIDEVKFTSTIVDEVPTSKAGCVAFDYDSNGWGAGNDMRGNRPGFAVELYGKNLHATSLNVYRLWIDPKSHLEVRAPDPIYATDANGESTGQVIGLRAQIVIWPRTAWGPKTLYLNGQPIPFDFYVKPAYAYKLGATRFQLVDGHYPEKPEPAQPTSLGFRLVKLPDLPAEDTVLDFRFRDATSLKPAQGIKILDAACAPSGDGDVRCQFAKTALGGLDEIEFQMPMPEGGLAWSADWKSDGQSDASTRLGFIEADRSARIIHAFSISDQTGEFRPQTRHFSYPYPGSDSGVQKREVALLGRNLPQKFTDDANIESLDPAIKYMPLYGIAYKDRYDKAWADLSKRFRIPVDELKATGDQLLLLDAKISGRTLPGEKALKLNGALASWDLRFGGLQASIEFIRPSGTAEPDGVIDSAYLPESIRVRVRTSSALPLDSLSMTLLLQRTNRDPASIAAGGKKATTLRRVNFTATRSFGGQLYLSPPIRLVDKGNPRLSPPPQPGDIPVDIFLNGGGPDQLAVQVDPAFAAKSFAMPITPASASLPISRSPGHHRSARDPIQDSDYLFKSALAEAAKCDGVEVADWDKLSQEEADNFYNLVVITFGDHLRKTTATLGDHAAMLLLRKMLVELLTEQLIKDNDIVSSQLTLKGFLKAMRLELDNENLAVNRIKVSAPDGSRVEYGSTALVENVDFLARAFKSTPEKMAQWRLDATAEAVARLASGAGAAADHARSVDACDVGDLLKLTATGFEAVADRLKPRLMRLVETRDPNGTSRLYWQRDVAARYWVDHIPQLARHLAAQRAEAKADNQALAMVFGVATLPIMAGGTTAVQLALMGADLTMLGADVADQWTKVYQGQVELDFSRDAAPVLGFERNDYAVRQAVTWFDAYERTLFDAGLGGLVAFGAKDAIVDGLMRSKSLFTKGRAVIGELPEGGLQALGNVERRNAELFALRSKAREAALGAEALDPLERRAIMAVEEDFRAARIDFLRESKAGKTLGSGDEVILPQSFGKEAERVTFVPAELAETAGPSRFVTLRGDDVTIRMARLGDESRLARAEANTLREGAAADTLREGVPPTTPSATLPSDRLDSVSMIPQVRRSLISKLRGKRITIRAPASGEDLTLTLGQPVGQGSFKVVFRATAPWEEYPLVVKITFGGGHDAAEVAGRRAWQFIEARSDSIAIPREAFVVDTVLGPAGPQRLVRQIAAVEDFGQTAASVVAQNEGGLMTTAQRIVYRKAIDDINEAGYVWLDCKWDNFTWIERDGELKLGILDLGGIVRVKGGDPALAREIQKIVNGPIEDVAEELAALGQSDPRLRRFAHQSLDEILAAWTSRDLRQGLIQARYGGDFENLHDLGVTSINHFDYAPAAGDQFSHQTAMYFSGHVKLR